MSEYQYLMDKSYIVREAAKRCMREGKISMAMVWTEKAVQLRDKAEALTVERAAKKR